MRKPSIFDARRTEIAIEPRALDQNISRAESDFRVGAAHHAANSDCARAVRDYAHFFRERAFGAIERANFFAWFRPAHHDPALVQSIEIVRVQRMAELEHHVVRRRPPRC